MNQSVTWTANIFSALVGAVVGLIGTIIALRNTALMAQATVYGDLLKRVSDLEANREVMGEVIYQKDRALISASRRSADEKAGRASEKARADRFEALSRELQERLDRIESAVREILNSPGLTEKDKERLLRLLDG